MPKVDLSRYVESSARRLQNAREIASRLTPESETHRLAMQAVFVLEDCHEAFVRVQAESEG